MGFDVGSAVVDVMWDPTVMMQPVPYLFLIGVARPDRFEPWSSVVRRGVELSNFVTRASTIRSVPPVLLRRGW